MIASTGVLLSAQLLQPEVVYSAFKMIRITCGRETYPRHPHHRIINVVDARLSAVTDAISCSQLPLEKSFSKS